MYVLSLFFSHHDELENIEEMELFSVSPIIIIAAEQAFSHVKWKGTKDNRKVLAP